MKKDFEKIKPTLFLILNLVLSVITMTLLFSLATNATEGNIDLSSLFLALTILSIIGYQAFLFIRYPNFKDRIRLIVISGLYSIAAIFAFIAKGNDVFFFYSTAMVVLTLSASQFLKIFFHNKEKTKAGIVTNALMGFTLLGFGILVIASTNAVSPTQILLVDVVLFLAITMKNIVLPSLKFSKVKIFLDILIKTHTFDVLICLLAMIIGFSFLFPMFEESISNYWDAMWYCFAVITTIGFGDFAATTAVGRVLTVLLGIYGIVVVAILTSAIVNYYNAITKKEKEEEKYIE